MKGLFDVLKAGNATLSTDQGYWVFLQSTYIDEVYPTPIPLLKKKHTNH